MGRTLYRLEGCPYCERVAEELDALECSYDSVWVEPLHSDRTAVKRASGQRVVPVLVDDEHGVTIAESERIIEFLGTTQPENN